MQDYELQPIFDNRKSFYGKARVEERHNRSNLISYTTVVACIINKPGGLHEAEVYGTYSQTTLRHVKEFLTQHHFQADNNKQIMADYGVIRGVK